MVKKIRNVIIHNKKEVIVSSFLILVLSIFFIGSAFAALTPTESVIITSKNTNYENNEAGSWQVKKSGKWISKGKARVSFDIDTTEMSKSKNTDVIMVMDVSSSMTEEKLDEVKQSSIGFIENLLSNSNNNVSLVSFANNFTVLSSFTNDKDILINQINDLEANGSTNYYQALVGVDTILKEYVKKDDTDVIVLFLVGGYPNIDTPNQIAQYRYLKDAYPYVTINAIQYAFGKDILTPIKEVSDHQYLANLNTLSTVLTDAGVIPLKYEKFQVVDYIDNNYFTLNSEDDITVSKGKVALEYEKGKQKIVWTIDNLKSGEAIRLTMDIDLKKEYVGEGGVYPTNEKEEIISKIEDKEESVSSTQTPVLAESYQVIYEGNAPDGASVSNVPAEVKYSVFSTAAISTEEPICEGYEFKGWEIVTKNVIRTGDDYFIMPEEDVVLRAKWSKVEIAKSMDGTVSTQGEPVMMGQSWWNTDYEKEKVTSIEIKTSTFIPDTAIAYWDASQAQDKSVVAYIEDDGNGDYKVSIGGLGGVIANTDCTSLFTGFINTNTINLDNFDTSNVTNMAKMFYGCSSLTSLDLSNFDTSNVTNMYDMFRDCDNLAYINLSNFDTSKTTNMGYMFSFCRNLTNLDVSNFDTSKVTDMSFMFSNCSNLTNLDLSNFNTSKVTTMSYMFSNCSSLISLDVSNFDTSKVINMYFMFRNCRNLTNLNVSNFNTKNVDNMSYMFYGCSSLTNLDVSNFDTSKVTNMSSMFNDCSSLTNLDLSNFNTSNVTNMGSVFQSCKSLTELDLNSFDTSDVTNMGYMFYNCNSLVNLDLNNFDTSKVTNMTFMFYNCNSLVKVDIVQFNTSIVTNMRSMFNGCSSLTNLDVSNFNTENVISMDAMFNGCKGLLSLNLSNFDTSKVTDMSSMFSNCSNLTNLDISNFNTENVNNMANMFKSCSSLTVLDVSSFNTSKVTTMKYMFRLSSSLTSLDVGNFDTSNVTDMSFMFDNCSSLINLDVSNFDTSKVNNMQSMFNSCSSLINLDVIGFNTSKVTNMVSMFNGCRKLTTLDVSDFDTLNVTSMSDMFRNCWNLTALDLSNFNTNNVVSMASMFNGCGRLEHLLLNNFDTSKVKDMGWMFQNCSRLISLDLSSFDVFNVSKMSYMFGGCSSLIKLDMRKSVFNATSYDNMFSSVNGYIDVIVKDSTAQSWVRSRLDEVNCSNATVTIATDVDSGTDEVVDSNDSVDIDNEFSPELKFELDDSKTTFGFDSLTLGYGVRFNIFSWL